jgi:L-amino acid N-acyltransferase
VDVRDATDADAEAISAIYNALVPTTTVAWTEELESVDQRRAWLGDQAERGDPVLVAEVGGEVVGFASYGGFRDSMKWPGYARTVEHTIHVREDHWGSGIGRTLMEALVDRARAAGKHVMVGALDGANDASLRFHERLGFVEVARMPEVGRKFGRWLDLVLVQRTLDP